jgi:hypothetical protein
LKLKRQGDKKRRNRDSVIGTNECLSGSGCGCFSTRESKGNKCKYRPEKNSKETGQIDIMNRKKKEEESALIEIEDSRIRIGSN